MAEAVGARLAQVSVGNPRNAEVRMGSLVSREQYDSVRGGIAILAGEARVLHDGRQQALVDADPAVAACVGPTLLGVRDGDARAACTSAKCSARSRPCWVTAMPRMRWRSPTAARARW